VYAACAAAEENFEHMTMPETTPQPMPQGIPAGGDAQLITLTDAAAAKVVELRNREGKSEAALRLFVKSGGCSGFSYGLAFDDRIAEDDRLEAHGDVRIVIDAFSVQYVDGAEIDYVDSLMGSGFAINNPNAVSSCACGSSFNTDGSPAKAGGCH
jgi:iron-sulfur cluster assembly protein